MNCRYEELLPAWLDGDLDSTRSQEVRFHLQECPACEALARSLEATWDLLGRQAELEVPVDFRAQVWQRIHALPARRVFPWRWALALAATLVLAVGGWRLMPSTPELPQVAVSTPASGQTAAPDPELSPVPRAGADLVALAPEWDLSSEVFPDELEPQPADPLEPLQLGQLSDDWMMSSDRALDSVLEGGS